MQHDHEHVHGLSPVGPVAIVRGQPTGLEKSTR